MIPEESRFEPDPEELVEPPEGLPAGGRSVRRTPTTSATSPADRAAARARAGGAGLGGAGKEDVLVEVSDHGLRTRQNVVVRDEAGLIRAWGSVHDRASGRMMFVHVVERGLPEKAGRACSDLLVEWAVGQARQVGASRGLAVQQIDTGAYADDERQQRWLAAAGFTKVRTWWQMKRPVAPEETGLVDDPVRWERDGVVVRLVDCEDDGKPVETDLRAVHDVLEAAFTDHFNSKPETFDEFLFRLLQDPGHRWDHWWLAEVDGRPAERWSGPSPAPGRTSPTSASSSWPAAAASPRDSSGP